MCLDAGKPANENKISMEDQGKLERRHLKNLIFCKVNKISSLHTYGSYNSVTVKSILILKHLRVFTFYMQNLTSSNKQGTFTRRKYQLII